MKAILFDLDDTLIDRSLAFRDYAEWVAPVVSERPGAEVVEHAVDFEGADGSFQETLRWRVDEIPSDGTRRRLPLFVAGGGGLRSVSLGRRRTAVEYEHPVTVRHTTRVEGLGPGTIPSRAIDDSGDGWSVAASIERSGAAWRADCELTLSRTRFEPDRFRDLRRLHSALGRAVNASLEFPGE